jgi:hypothetical protein
MLRVTRRDPVNGHHAICPIAAFCQQGELGSSPIRRTLKRRIQSFLYRWLWNDLRSLAPVSDGTNCHAKILGE